MTFGPIDFNKNATVTVSLHRKRWYDRLIKPFRKKYPAANATWPSAAPVHITGAMITFGDGRDPIWVSFEDES